MPPSTNPLVVALAVIVTAVVGLGLYDLSLAMTYGHTQTISYRLTELSRGFLLIPLIVGLTLGLFLGHVYWSQKP